MEFRDVLDAALRILRQVARRRKAPFAIRRASEEDIDSVFEMYFHERANRFLYLNPMGKEDFARFFERMLQRKHCYIYVRGGKVLGFISCDKHTGQEVHIAHISPIVVHSGRHGRGIGSELMRFMLARLKEEGIKRVELVVNSDNRKALRLFRKFGFRREATLKKHAKRKGAYCDDFIMVKFLR